MNKLKLNLSKNSIISIIKEVSNMEIEINEVVDNNTKNNRESNNKCDTTEIVGRLEELINKIKALVDYNSILDLTVHKDIVLEQIKTSESKLYEIQCNSDSIMHSINTIFKLIYTNYHKDEYNKCIDLLIETISIIKYIPQCENKPILNENGDEAYANISYISKLENDIKALCDADESPSKTMLVDTLEGRLTSLLQHLKISTINLKNIALLKYASTSYINYKNEDYDQCTRNLNNMLSILRGDINEDV